MRERLEISVLISYILKNWKTMKSGRLEIQKK